MANLAIVAAVLNQRRNPRPRIFRDRTKALEIMDDEELLMRYRLPRHCILELCDLLKPDLERPTSRSHALLVSTQVLTALRFYATGSFQRVDGDVHGISQASVSRIVANVSASISRRAGSYISFPTTAGGLRRTMSDFHAMAGFPNVIGCIDGTQIPIHTPSIHEYLYVCRKGFHSMNVQAVCDAKLSFTNIVAKFPGSSHDSFILRNSKIYEHLEEQINNGG